MRCCLGVGQKLRPGTLIQQSTLSYALSDHMFDGLDHDSRFWTRELSPLVSVVQPFASNFELMSKNCVLMIALIALILLFSLMLFSTASRSK